MGLPNASKTLFFVEDVTKKEEEDEMKCYQIYSELSFELFVEKKNN